MQIYISRSGQQFGPFSRAQIQQGLAQGSLVHSDLAWHEGAPNWVPIGQLAPKTESPKVSPPQPATTPNPAPSKQLPKVAPKGMSKKWQLWSGIGAGVIVIGALVWWLYPKDQTPAIPEEEPIVPPTPEQIEQSAKAIEKTLRQKINKPTGSLLPADLNKVSSLQLFDSGLHDVSPLANLNHVTVLDLAGNRISNITPLAKLTNLEELALDRNLITDLSALANLTKLKNLGLENNRITSLAPLTQLKQLKFLQLKNNRHISAEQIQQLQSALPNCRIDFDDRPAPN
ncbi:MAG: hypothetical protein CMO66_06840 [Verrucomicrobiales bacterium]|nr:hypothetical protein [Verrucomicrobiales bacterium]